jgi:2-methylcitrate dehydratase PrpD
MFLDAIARFRTLRLAELPAEAITVARQCVLDWLGCALAGSAEPLAAILRDEVVEVGGPATVLGTLLHTTPRAAALVNGAAGHALDFDDTHTGMNGHPTAPVLPAALALAEALDASGERLLAAYVAGIEVECRLGLYIGPEHYARGWHATGTLGTVGAAAAAAHLLGLDEKGWRTGLNLAATQAAGLKASFGSMAKPLHAGRAASDGLLAARLAARGFTAAPDAFDSPQGLIAASGDGHGRHERLAETADRFLIGETLFKYHAACYLTHAAINAATTLREALRPDAIDTVEVRVNPSLLNVCAIPEPSSGLELKFSLRGTTAMALLGLPTGNLAAYTDALAHDPALVALRDRVRIVTDDALPTTRAIVEVKSSGQTLRAEEDTGRPAQDLALQGRRLEEKFLALARPIVGDERAQRLVETVAAIEGLASVRRLTALLGRQLVPA